MPNKQIKTKKIKYRKKKKAIVGENASVFGRAALRAPVMDPSHNQNTSFGTFLDVTATLQSDSGASLDELAMDSLPKEVVSHDQTSFAADPANNKLSNPSIEPMENFTEIIPFWKRMLTFLGISRNK